MWFFNSIFGKIFELIFWPLQNMSPWIGMILISFLTALLMLFVFRYTSNQKGIKRVKDRIKAHLLEIRLFKDNLSLSLKAQGNILRCNLKYLGYTAKPFLVMIVPLILILIQLNLWFGYQALNPGQKALLKVKLEESSYPQDVNISLQPSSKLNIETHPLRIEEKREIDWRFSAKENGVHDLTIIVNEQKIAKKVFVNQKSLSKISSQKVRKNFIEELFNPGEPPLKGSHPIKSIEVAFPSKTMSLLGWNIPWILGVPPWLMVYFVLSIFFGFVFKSVFKVEI